VDLDRTNLARLGQAFREQEAGDEIRQINGRGHHHGKGNAVDLDGNRRFDRHSAGGGHPAIIIGAGDRRDAHRAAHRPKSSGQWRKADITG
jgi:hypothetical protein